MALVASRDPTIEAEVRSVVLDSPVLDWKATFGSAFSRRHVPWPFTALTEAFVAWRTGLDYGQFDQLRYAKSMAVPVLLFQGDADRVVPQQVAAKFAAERPSVISYVPIRGVDHVSGIDTDPSAYFSGLQGFLYGYP